MVKWINLKFCERIHESIWCQNTSPRKPKCLVGSSSNRWIKITHGKITWLGHSKPVALLMLTSSSFTFLLTAGPAGSADRFCRATQLQSFPLKILYYVNSIHSFNLSFIILGTCTAKILLNRNLFVWCIRRVYYRRWSEQACKTKMSQSASIQRKTGRCLVVHTENQLQQVGVPILDTTILTFIISFWWSNLLHTTFADQKIQPIDKDLNHPICWVSKEALPWNIFGKIVTYGVHSRTNSFSKLAQARASSTMKYSAEIQHMTNGMAHKIRAKKFKTQSYVKYFNLVRLLYVSLLVGIVSTSFLKINFCISL